VALANTPRAYSNQIIQRFEIDQDAGTTSLMNCPEFTKYLAGVLDGHTPS
jgi:hypothetical protein